MIGKDILPRLSAPPGRLLVQPKVMDAMTKSGLHLPLGYRKHTRSTEVSVVEGSEFGLEKGTRLLLAATAGRRFYLGYTSAEEDEILCISPDDILLELLGREEAASQNSSLLRGTEGRTDFLAEEVADDKWDEGDRDGLR